MLALLIGLIAWPFVRAIWMSFHLVVGPRWLGWVGLANYQAMLNDPIFRRSLGITLQYTAESVFFKFWIGLAAALALHNVRRWKSVLTALILAPYIVPNVVAAAMWRFLFNPQVGGLNATLLSLNALTGGLLGVDKGISWTGDPAIALHSMVLVNIWKGVPFFTLLALAGLKGIDRELYDAAAVDGANTWQRFLHITLPSLRYVIIVETLFSLITTFNTFDLIYLITVGGPGGATRVYAIRVVELVGSLTYGRAVALTMLVVPILAVLVIILGRYMRGGQRGIDEGENVLYRGLMFCVWPVKMVVRLGLAIFWAVNDAVERAASAVARVFFGRVALSSAGAGRRINRAALSLLVAVPLIAIAFFELYPFYWIIITAFKTNQQIIKFTNIFWPDPWTLEHFDYLIYKSSFLLWLRNTVLVATVATAISLAVSSLGAYALVRLRWVGSGFVSTAILLTYVMPTILLVVPLYQVLSTLHLTNTLGALMLTYPTFLMPFACWLLMGYYRSVPEELEEAALIDGCNKIQAFYRIVLPLVTPALIAVALFAVTGAWNEFTQAFIFIQSNNATTLPVGIGRMIVGDVFQWGPIMAASVTMAIPVVCFYAFAQRFLVEGLTAGSVKG
jgi:multiple sugar transport system permease protein